MHVFITVFLLGFSISILTLTNKKMLFLYILTFVLIFQNISIMILLKTELVNTDNGKHLLLLKEVILVSSLIILGLKNLITRKLKINIIDILVIIYFSYILFRLPVETSIPLEAKLAGFRSLFLLPALYLLGRLIYWHSFDAKKMISFLITISINIAIFGLVEVYVLPKNFWIWIGQEKYYLMKEGRRISGLLYDNMYYWDFGEPIRRLASIIGDPLMTSFMLSYSVLLLGYWTIYIRPIKLRKGHLFLAFIFLALLLTFGRAAVITLLSGFCIFLLSFNTFMLVVLMIFSLLIVTSFLLLYRDNILGIITGFSHIEGLQSGLLYGVYNPIGGGIGISSNIAHNVYRTITTAYIPNIGGDSYLGSVSGQIGIIGVIFLYGFLLTLTVRLYYIYKALYSHSQSRLLYTKTLLVATITMLIGVFLVSTVSESSTSFVGSGIAFIMSGILISAHSIEKKSSHKCT